MSTPALTPCYTNLSDKAPTPLTFQHDTQQSELINDRDADSSEDSIGSTQFCVSNNRGIGTAKIGTDFIGRVLDHKDDIAQRRLWLTDQLGHSDG